MTDWVNITRDELTEAERAHARQFIADADSTDHCDQGYITLMNAGGWTVTCPGDPVKDEHVAELLAQLVEVRRDMPRRAGWRYLVDLVVGRGEPSESLRAVYDRETGISEDEAFPPALDPDMPEGHAVVAEEIRRNQVHYEALRAREAENARRHAERTAQAQVRRRPPPARTPDPRQMALVLPFDRAGLQGQVEVHIRSWLGPGVPSPVSQFLQLRAFRGGAAARVVLFDGETATLFAYGPYGRKPVFRSARSFFFHKVEHRWVRATEGMTREQAVADGVVL